MISLIVIILLFVLLIYTIILSFVFANFANSQKEFTSDLLSENQHNQDWVHDISKELANFDIECIEYVNKTEWEIYWEGSECESKCKDIGYSECSSETIWGEPTWCVESFSIDEKCLQQCGSFDYPYVYRYNTTVCTKEIRLGYRYFNHRDGTDVVYPQAEIKSNVVRISVPNMPSRWFVELTKTQAIKLAEEIIDYYDCEQAKRLMKRSQSR